MNKKVFLALTVSAAIAVLLIFLNSCSSEKKKTGVLAEEIVKNPFSMSFVEEKEKKFDSVVAKFGPFFANIDDPEHIYVYFNMNREKNCEVLKLTDDLEIKDKYIIKFGEGPGEARNPRIYGGNADSIVVWAPMRKKFIEFDSNFILKTEYRAKYLGMFMNSGGRFIPEQRSVIDGYDKEISRYESSTQIYIRKILPGSRETEDGLIFESPLGLIKRKSDNKTVLFVPIILSYYSNYIYVLNKKDYQISKIDLHGNVVKEKKFSFKSAEFSEADRKKWVGKFFGKISREPFKRFDFPEKLFPANWILPIGQGIAVGKSRNYDLDDEDPISADYFDLDLNYLGEISIPNFRRWNQPAGGHSEVHNCVLYRNGKLYFLKRSGDNPDEIPSIVVWKVKNENN